MTTTAQHTPGPWQMSRQEYDNTHSTDLSIYAPVPPHNNPKSICRVYGEGGLSAIIEERDANAALIAAAPELLAALKFCAAALEAEAGKLYAAHLEQARAAIAKTTGREVLR